ncbi:hypothetical protein [Prevotella sp. BV3P1]|uniref:hypothetical protein n=1 Tax=Prevotella sp. BV3P1 TaxID=1111130 RepID=UPI00055F7A96|nr:hypothetical protein [Prevotella sp. BV3P1]
MAFGGVETGSMKPNEAESATSTATGTGLNPAERAVPMASGPVMLFAPVCEVSSDSSSDITQRVGAMRESTQKRSDFLLRLKQIPRLHAQADALYVWCGSNQRIYRGRLQAGQQGSIASCIAPQCLFYTMSFEV